MEMFLTPEIYSRLVEALADHRYDRDDPANAVKIALGELADIWPDSIKGMSHE